LKYDLSIILTEELYNLYSLSDEFGFMNILYKYLYIRCGLAINNKKPTNKDLINFVLEELNIETFQKENNLSTPVIIYNDEEYGVLKIGEDFVENLEFRANFEGDMNLNEIMYKIYKIGYRKSTKYRELREYKDYIKYNRLMILNEMFGITPKYSDGVDGFKTSLAHNPYKRSLEESLEAILSSSKSLGSNTTTHITEEQLEDYLVNNIELIEDDLVFLRRQVEIPGGIVDIIAKDKDDNICIIEIKINEDKGIVWQAMHYPKEISKKYWQKEIRMITIAPSYSEYILGALKDINNIETLVYNIKVSMGNIDNLDIKSV